MTFFGRVVDAGVSGPRRARVAVDVDENNGGGCRCLSGEQSYARRFWRSAISAWRGAFQEGLTVHGKKTSCVDFVEAGLVNLSGGPSELFGFESIFRLVVVKLELSEVKPLWDGVWRPQFRCPCGVRIRARDCINQAQSVQRTADKNRLRFGV